MNRKFQIIYADPPWTYKNSGGLKNSRGLAKKYYQTMTLEDICKLPIRKISNKNSYCFLWVTAPGILEGLITLQHWGFKFVTIAFTWIKVNKISNSLFWGMGNFTRANPEYVLIGRRGKIERLDKGVHSVIIDRLKKHSEKPKEVRKRIERLYGDVSRIELFARDRKKYQDGWINVGNEVDGQDIKIALKQIRKGTYLDE